MEITEWKYIPKNKFWIEKTLMKIPFLSFEYRNTLVKNEILAAFEEFFDRSWYIMGNKLLSFETAFAAFIGTKYCIGTSNGLDALFLSLKALDIGEGDEVIVPSYTFIASALAVTYTGAKPVFVEPKIDTYNLDTELIEGAITPRTKALMPVHLFGQACDMDQIMSIAKRHHLYVIEDNAQAQGAEWNGRATSSFGDINAVSFYPAKNLGALGDAGAINTDSEQLAQRVMSLRNYGSAVKYYNEEIGYNKRLDECQAAFLYVFLKYLPDWNVQRQQIAHYYHEALKDIEGLVLPKIEKGATHVYHQFVIRTHNRDQLQEYLSSKGIGTLIHYPIPPHLQKCYNDLGHHKGDFPIAEEISDSILSLPIYPGMTQNQVQYIAEQIINEKR